MASILDSFLRRMVRTGSLTVLDGRGGRTVYGDGGAPGVTARISARAARRIAIDQALGLGESYMDGELVLEQGDIWDLLRLVGINYANRPATGGLLKRLTKPLRKRLQQANDRAAARRHVAHHYDLSNELYRRFLDVDMQYSCAYFATPGVTLEAAQAAKKAHIIAKLRVRPGDRVLDIGCGWGGMGLELAGVHDAKVTGVTLSTEQVALAQARAAEAGLADAAHFQITDYRDVAGPFERIVSVGMFEHVGVPNYREFFTDVARLLTDDGVALIHSIGRSKGPGVTNSFTQKYIFPGGYIPALSEVLPAVEQSGLRVADIEVLQGWHYAETLRCWGERFVAERDWVLANYDERFCRMWEFYLAGAEMGFRYGQHMNFQLQLVKAPGALPVTRDYMLGG